MTFAGFVRTRRDIDPIELVRLAQLVDQARNAVLGRAPEIRLLDWSQDFRSVRRLHSRIIAAFAGTEAAYSSPCAFLD